VLGILRSAVIEEMLHMVLAANVLNALGGRPLVASEDVVPSYPGHLPGGVEGQLMVRLRPFSLEQLMVFIEIEEPRDPIGIPEDEGPDEVGECTIGEFYTSIEQALMELDDDDFIGDPARQIGPELMVGSVRVSDRDTAIEAISTIIEQGEGSKGSPEHVHGTGEVHELAHYYRFLQIHHGRHLTRVDENRFEYIGGDLLIDADGLYALPDDPSTLAHPEGSEERALLRGFNLTYSALLSTVQRLFDGEAHDQRFTELLDQMHDLDRQARVMVAKADREGIAIGPSFEYLSSTS